MPGLTKGGPGRVKLVGATLPAPPGSGLGVPGVGFGCEASGFPVFGGVLVFAGGVAFFSVEVVGVFAGGGVDDFVRVAAGGAAAPRTGVLN